MKSSSSLAHPLSDAPFSYVIRPLISVKVVAGCERRRGPTSRPTAGHATELRAYDLQHDQFASAVFVGQGNDGSLVVAEQHFEYVNAGVYRGDWHSVVKAPQADGAVT